MSDTTITIAFGNCDIVLDLVSAHELLLALQRLFNDDNQTPTIKEYAENFYLWGECYPSTSKDNVKISVNDKNFFSKYLEYLDLEQIKK